MDSPITEDTLFAWIHDRDIPFHNHVKLEEHDGLSLDFFQDQTQQEYRTDESVQPEFVDDHEKDDSCSTDHDTKRDDDISVSSSSWSCLSPSVPAMSATPFKGEMDDVYTNFWNDPPFVEDPSKSQLQSIVKILEQSLITEVSNRQAVALELERKTKACEEALWEANDKLRKMIIRRGVYIRTIKQLREQNSNVTNKDAEPCERRKLKARIEVLERRLALQEGRDHVHVETKMQAQYTLMIQENHQLSQEVKSLQDDLSQLADELIVRDSRKKQKLV